MSSGMKKSLRHVKEIYPNGIHSCIAEFLDQHEDVFVRTASLDEPEHGLTDDVLANTDVLIWSGTCPSR